ncbi:hypothetical protein Pcinc_012362 [Petrolisthes cinctipes]|uniref:Uncharacterized protein n=1 Tax=Petrolisthes cinctipes TaxID=88211 RepID=A0AAE1KRJ6_PETCI|nr:hypothetical protein Pcinc_012362 [Petrolisthes cinctipes]
MSADVVGAESVAVSTAPGPRFPMRRCQAAAQPPARAGEPGVTPAQLPTRPCLDSPLLLPKPTSPAPDDATLSLLTIAKWVS